MQDQRADAAHDFQASITQTDEELQHTTSAYETLDTKALALCGLALTTEPDKAPDKAVEAAKAFLAARAITCADGVVNQTLALFNMLTIADDSDVLPAIRPSIGAGAGHG